MNINPSKDRKAIRLQFTVEGARFSFSPLPGGKWENKRDRQLVAAIATKIENDILAGNFDPSLGRYRHKLSAAQTPLRVKANPKICWLELWDAWVVSLDLPISTAADHYACVRAMLVKSGNPSLDNTEWLQISELAASTFNRRLSMLRSCLLWAVEEGLIKPADNPLKRVRSRTATEDERQRSDKKKAPLSDAEIEKILNYVDRVYITYAPFVRFLLFSGVRTGEAVGLTWDSVDLEKRLIFIRQSVSRQRGKYQKICKSPKTKESVRTLKMSDRVFVLFSSIITENACGLIFKSPKGQIIDHGNFRSQCWMPTLLFLDIPYRKPYATRHTLLSQALESGLSVPQVAQIAGHRDGKMILQHYGHVINQPQLP
ncbi:MAG: site-specific integrase [Microcoleus sp. PH2017_29_MFU_D_A]|uniref:site-specific integrase n=1 Tax=unclassified Microcoleus TaxID=2642155 RepID=UPI001D965AAB|nr:MULTISPECIES: site-specific integrase [unclassified Microcoleus]TAE51272.1 MAG: site-specific integrase [Oscillatoriales cyanobacterium]MCC3410581.1 site-specific integrase [Microcoleus sp. PH2017_02_FOX_O_A]MCC3439359.1 site-specific integrase [Microcoleus sp. PH2017_05_CCC_O_A]MCC3455747.1 site-specific integrase [Microcoleus sp. PH2017_08_TRC_O_A]MCC3489230.1 site-specific integrase [Microcoleus sp. PH2017_16_JOR_D_A]